MESTIQAKQQSSTTVVITPEALLDHWQGHRRLTRKVIEAFPEEELFRFSVGGMRPFAELSMEMIQMAAPGIYGIVTGNWNMNTITATPKTKKEILDLWDKVTADIDNQWSKIQPQRFLERDVAFGQYEGPVYRTLFYFIDNEIHHRGQGYVYLRALGIEPPPFWER